MTHPDANEIAAAKSNDRHEQAADDACYKAARAAGVHSMEAAELCDDGACSWEGMYTMKAVMVLPTGSGLFTLDQLTTATAAARVQALEDAAVIAEHENAADWSVSGQIARRVRALKGGAA